MDWYQQPLKLSTLTKMCSPDTKMSVLHLSIQVQVKIIIISPFTVLKVLLYLFFKYIYYNFPLCADWRWHRKNVKATQTWLFGQAWRVVCFAQKVFQTSSKMSNPNAPGLGNSPNDKTAYIGKFGFISDKSQIITEMLSALYLGPNFPLADPVFSWNVMLWCLHMRWSSAKISI